MKKRLAYLDVLRVIAILAVLLMHSASSAESLISKNTTDFPFHFTLFFNALTRFAVPLFLMISGSLMINTNRPYSVIIKKILHFLTVFLIWSFLYTLVLYFKDFGSRFSISLFLDIAYDTLKGRFHFWYIFLICGLYLILPFIDILIQNINNSQKKLFVTLSVVLCFVGPLFSLFDISKASIAQHLSEANVGFVGGYALYFMLGYWLKDVTVKSYKWPVICLLTSAIFTIGVSSYLSIGQGETVKIFMENITPNILLLTVSLFLLIKKRFETGIRSSFFSKSFSLLSRLSFGVYLVHMLVLDRFSVLVPLFTDNIVVALLFIFFGTTLVSYLITYILYHIPFTRKIVT